jgi:hypothetical protein
MKQSNTKSQITNRQSKGGSRRSLSAPWLPAACLIALSCPFGLFAAPQSAKTSGKSSNSSAATQEKPLTAIPADAESIDVNTYRWTDGKGKKWILIQTPFGISKHADTGEPMRDKHAEFDDMADVRVVEDGDSLKFERSTPFGPQRWTKKKTNLTDAEKAAWKLHQAKDASKDASAKQDR